MMGENQKREDGMTPDQLKALRYAAGIGGRYWKVVLQMSWYRGDEETHYGPTHGPVLRQVRNELGPKWLRKFRIKEV